MCTAKNEVGALLAKLPDDCTLEDVQYHLYVLIKIHKGLADVEQGRTIGHEDLKREIEQKWFLANR
jgi:predicted transcriptional regulator